MVITELYLKNFGKFTERHFYLDSGLQVISGENEFGKSTLHAFIRAMLFGLERGRGRAAAKDAFTRYEPWENPGCYAGVMRFTCGEKHFRLERSFDRFTKRAVLVCEDDGEELSVEHGDLDMLLGGLTPGLFDSTVSVGQLQAEPGQELFAALENYAANYFETGSGDIDLEGAFRVLKEKKRSVAREQQAEEAALSAGRDKILAEQSYLEKEMQTLRGEFDERQRRLNAMEGTAQETEGETLRGRSLAVMGVSGILIGVIGLLWGWFVGGGRTVSASAGLSGAAALPFGLIGGLITLAGVVLLAAGIFRGMKEQSAGGSIRLEDTEDAKRLRWEMEHIRAEWKEKEIRCSNLKEQCEDDTGSESLEALKRRQRAIEMADAALRKAADSTGNETARFLGRKASEIFAGITGGAYRQVGLDREQHLFAWDGSRRIPAERLSRGTLEQIYLSVRLAAAEMLLEEPMPLILDDVFAFYDDKRLESALKWLSRQKKQVIIFSCHNREEQIVKRENCS